MTAIATSAAVGVDPVDELRDWLEENWDPDLTVGEWWERLGLAGWANPILPPDCFGRGSPGAMSCGWPVRSPGSGRSARPRGSG
jgi:hypothetical protein